MTRYTSHSAPLCVLLMIAAAGCLSDSGAPDPAPDPPAWPATEFRDCWGLEASYIVEMEWAEARVPDGYRPTKAGGIEGFAAMDQYILECQQALHGGTETGPAALALNLIALSNTTNGVNPWYFVHSLIVEAGEAIYDALAPAGSQVQAGTVAFERSADMIQVSVESEESAFAVTAAGRTDSWFILTFNTTLILDEGSFRSELERSSQQDVRGVTMQVERGDLATAALTGSQVAGVGREIAMDYPFHPRQ